MNRNASVNETNYPDNNLRRLADQLQRVGAAEVKLSLDDEFEPKYGTLLRVEIGQAYWHLPVQDFQRILEGLHDNTGSEAIKRAIESKASHVWHGPAPRQNRDTSF